jgi:micrococcal nuclease
VVDGDTVKVDGQRFRLESCDAPETFWAKCAGERELGYAARDRLRDLIETRGWRMYLTGRHCAWGRPCIDLFLGDENACDVLIRERLATTYSRGQRRERWCD